MFLSAAEKLPSRLLHLSEGLSPLVLSFLQEPALMEQCISLPRTMRTRRPDLRPQLLRYSLLLLLSNLIKRYQKLSKSCIRC